jgi:serine protease Do
VRRTTVVIAGLALVAVAGSIVAQTGAKDEFRRQIDFAKSKVYPALVNINVVSERFSGGRTVRVGGAGSGTIISPAGHVLTNYHVARDASRIVCTLPSGEQIAADVVGDDAATDLAVLKLRLTERKDPTRPLPFAVLGDSDQLQVGDSVIAVGNPLSLSSSMTLGIVSNPRRVFTRGNQIQEFDFGGGNKTGMFTVWIQHDALILPGNSGGPLVNLEGEIVGINTRAGAGYGFAAPSNLTKRVVSQILTYGEVRRGWVGLSFLPVNKLERTVGVLVASVAPDSPAEKAGIRAGDVLLELDGRATNCRFLEEIPDLYAAIAEMRVGRKVTAVLARGGERVSLPMTVAPMAGYVGDQVELRDLGITIQNITRPMARARRYPDTRGVVLTGVRGGQVFEDARPRVRSGDVIIRVGDRPVADVAAFRNAIQGLRKNEAKKATVVFRRDREILVTVVELDKEEPRKPGGELAKPWLGIKTQVLTPKVAEALDLKGRKGFRITDVFPWTKAHAAGLEVDDVLLAVDDEPLTASRPQDARDLKNLIEDLSIGEEVTLTVLRDGRETKVVVELEESPASALDAKSTEDTEFEFKVRDLTFMDRIDRKLEKDQQGVLVTEATSGGWASVAGIRKNDIVMKIQDRPVTGVKDFKKAMKQVIENRPKVVKIFMRRGYQTTFVFIEPDWAKAGSGEKK